MTYDESHAEILFQKFVRSAGCPLNWLGGADTRTFDCLSNLSSETMTQLAQVPYLEIFGPTIDRKSPNCFFCRDVLNFEDNSLAQFDTSKNILLGTNAMEGALFAALLLPEVLPPFNGQPKSLTLNELAMDAGVVPVILRTFGSLLFNNIASNALQTRQRLVDVIGDFLFVCPDKMLLDNWLKVKGEGRIYYYRLDYRSSNSVWNRNWIVSATHMDDLEFVFGWPLLEHLRNEYNDYDRLVARNVINMWSNFAKHGKLINSCNEQVVSFDQVEKGPSGYVAIDSTGIKQYADFPANLCNTLNVNFFKLVGKLWTQLVITETITQSAITIPAQIVRQVATLPTDLSQRVFSVINGK